MSFLNPHGLFATLDMYIYIVYGLRRNILRLCLFRHLEIFWGKTLPKLLEKWFPLQGERAHSQTPISIQIKSQIKSNLFFSSSFFLCLQGQPELCGSYHLLQSCFSFFVRLHGQPFGSYHLLQSCFSFSSVSMANLNRLVATSFALLLSPLGCLLATTFSSLSFLSNSFSSPHFNLLGVARRCFSWSSVSDNLFFSSCNFLVILLALSFLRPILSHSFLCSSV